MGNEFMAVGTAGGSIAVRSSDGVNWTFAGIIDNSTNQPPEAVAYGTGKYVAMGSGKSWFSDNGSAWSLGNPSILTDNGSGPDVPFHSKDLVFANNEFLAVGTADDSRALRSSDGVNWTFAGIIDN